MFDYIDEDAPIFGEELTAIRAVEEMLADNSTTFEETLPNFWATTYLLANDVRAVPFGTGDPDADDWRDRLADVADRAPSEDPWPDIYRWLGGDGFSPLARFTRVLAPIELPTNQTVTARGPIGFGGVAAIDLTNGYNGSGDVELEFAVADSRPEKVALMAISYDDDYPWVCAVEGPVFAVDDLAELSVAQSGDCDTMTVLMVQIDPNSTHSPGVDRVKIQMTFVPDDI